MDDLSVDENLISRLRVNESFYSSQEDGVKKELREIFESERHKLRLNQMARELVYTKYFPFFMVAISIYVIFSLIWIFYNVASYRRQKRELREKERLFLQQESKRLLERYHEVPSSSSNSIEQVESVKNIEISEYFEA